jgi:hypothetical protein
MLCVKNALCCVSKMHYAVCQKCIMLCVKNSNFFKKGMFFPFEHRSPRKVCTIGHARDVQKNR